MTATLLPPIAPLATRCANRVGRHRSTRPRTLNLIDLENLVGGHISCASVQQVWSQFGQLVNTCHSDLTTVAVSRRHAATAFFALPANLQRVIGGNGPDGADIALIDSVDVDWVAANFGQVVIGSGDHIFAPLACRLRDNGLHVVQVTGRGSCSTALYQACSEHRYLARIRPAQDRVPRLPLSSIQPANAGSSARPFPSRCRPTLTDVRKIGIG